MKKNQYLAPQLHIVILRQKDGILLNASGDNQGLLGAGDGTTKDRGISSGDVKGQTDYNVWDDDWSR